MINLSEFVRRIVVNLDIPTVNYAYQREIESLWRLNAEIEDFTVQPGQSLIQLSGRTKDVNFVCWNRRIIHQTTTSVLDTIDRNWRQAVPEQPRHWLYQDEENLQQIRIHPASALVGHLQVFEMSIPTGINSNWFLVLFAFKIISRLAVVDQRRARPEIGEVFDKLSTILIERQLNGHPDKRSNR